METANNRWEEKTRQPWTEFKERFSDGMQIASVANMMPRIIQEYVYANIGPDVSYVDMNQKVKIMAGQKASMDVNGPVPIDVGAAGGSVEG